MALTIRSVPPVAKTANNNFMASTKPEYLRIPEYVRNNQKKNIWTDKTNANSIGNGNWRVIALM